MTIFRGAEQRQIEEALSEVVIMAELRPALDILARVTGSVEAEYFRFPRYSTGPLGAAMLTRPADTDIQPAKPHAFAAALAGQKRLMVVTLDALPFAARGSTGLVLGRDAPDYTRKEQALLAQSLSAWSSAARRISKFEAVSGQNTGLTALIEKRLGACAILASPQGDIIWMSQSAREALDGKGRAMLEERLRRGVKELVNAPAHGAKEFAISEEGKRRLYGAMSFVREGPDTSVHYLAVELFGSDVHADADEAKLTPSEREIYKLLKLGQSNEEMARARFVSIETVRSHVKTIFRKLGVSSRVELLVRKPHDD